MTVHEALAQVVRDVRHVAKTTSRQVNYEFRSIDSVLDALHPLLAKAGLTLSVEVDAAHLRLEYATVATRSNPNANVTRVVFPVYVRFVAEDGTSERFGPGLAQSDDYGDKAVYQAQQNALKYLLLSAFSIPVNEPDMDGRPGVDVPQVDEGAWQALVEHVEDPERRAAVEWLLQTKGQTFDGLDAGWRQWLVGALPDEAAWGRLLEARAAAQAVAE